MTCLRPRFAALALACLGLATSACVTNRCVASSTAIPGSVSSCCGGSPSYYWTGTRCERDTACQCDATPASPSWNTLQACEEKHRTCGEFDAR